MVPVGYHLPSQDSSPDAGWFSKLAGFQRISGEFHFVDLSDGFLPRSPRQANLTDGTVSSNVYSDDPCPQRQRHQHVRLNQ